MNLLSPNLSYRATLILATIFTSLIAVLAYFSYGPITMMVIAAGFLIGFALWRIFPGIVEYRKIQKPFWLTMLAFLFLHKPEEAIMKFQEKLSEITGVPVSPPVSPALIALGVFSVGGWFLIPNLTKERSQLGTFLAWTFFASMGATELTHFLFPFFSTGPYSYFPGMASVLVLAPYAWWGLFRLKTSRLT